jgi:ABC-type transport system substrate-binding protein
MKTNGKWWDKLGTPRYGGELVIRANWDIVNFDPYNAPFGNIFSAWMETLTSDDWALDPKIFDFKSHWRPYRYVKGGLAKNWEFKDSNSYVVHLRKGIHWQNISPADGREFVADDVVFHFNRMYGLGGGFTVSSLLPASVNALNYLESVVALDKHTVVFKFTTDNREAIIEALHGVTPMQCIENPEAVQKWGKLDDWHHAIGTGPFILKDFFSGNSATLVKNPRYWGTDERYPQNKLPYLNSVKFLIVPDDDTAIETMRNGGIDIIDHISPILARSISKTNPEILQIIHPDSNAASIEPRNDRAPFTDIRVRKAMQMSLDLPHIAKSYYQGTVEPYPATLTSRYINWWGFPYEEWPQDLKDEYTYNPIDAKKLLSEAGYPDGFMTNIIVDAESDINLLLIVKSYFAEVGIDMQMRTMNSADWDDFIMAKHMHSQLAHRPAGPLGKCSSPTLNLSVFQKGNRMNWAMVNDPVFDAFLKRATAAIGADDIKEVMRDANEYALRQHFTISLLQPMAYSLCQPWVKGFNAQFGSAWAHAAGPALLSFYLGRFWIDEKLKKTKIY